MPAEIKVGVIAHPSVHLEDMIFGRDAGVLAGKAQRPILLLPAGNDPERYRSGGDIYESLKAVQPSSDVDLRFSEMTHGWVPRGNLSDPAVETGVDMAMKASIDYFARFMADGGGSPEAGSCAPDEPPPPAPRLPNPGAMKWEEAVNMLADDARAMILRDRPNLQVVVVPEGSMVTKDHRMDRVRIFVNPQGRVARAPKLG
jgi:hypothetical protein